MLFNKCIIATVGKGLLSKVTNATRWAKSMFSAVYKIILC